MSPDTVTLGLSKEAPGVSGFPRKGACWISALVTHQHPLWLRRRLEARALLGG
ncbi:unnamed protein product [Lepidochelys olivacea]